MTFEGGPSEPRLDEATTPVDASPAPARLPSTADRVINLAIGAGVLLLVAAIAVVAGLATGVIRRPGTVPAGLPAPIRVSVVLVPMTGFPTDQAAAMRDQLASDYGLPISVAPAISTDASTIDGSTRQLVGERVIQQLGRTHPEWQSRVLVIGLTVNDLRIDARPDWRFAFSYRVGDGVAVISAARMIRNLDLGETARWKRMTKMVTRTVAFLYYGLPPKPDPADLLYDNILSVVDLDRIADHL